MKRRPRFWGALALASLAVVACDDTAIEPAVEAAVETLRPPASRRSLSPEELRIFEANRDDKPQFALVPTASASLQTAEDDFEGRLVASSSQVSCDLGAIACGGVEVSQHSFNMLGWASTWKQTAGAAGWLTVDGGGSWQRGTEVPNYFILYCHAVLADSCSDTEVMTHTCDSEWNRMGLTVLHTAGADGNVFFGTGTAENDCPGPFGGGGPGGGGMGGSCDTETWTIEVYNYETGQWEYHSTVTGTYCV